MTLLLRSMKRKLSACWASFTIIAVLILSGCSSTPDTTLQVNAGSNGLLKPSLHQAIASVNVIQMLKNHHYKKMEVDEKLSTEI
ncbi:hypothetical protein M3P05_17815 [Sansalvadorimonas sp. 2012CJ34-2]|uniref:Uncharacterized protein n=1 Tax=Parendozoicomonas callyspongiae TaxID=2942213 RepID=A0ABT0PK69_9GAMM|nr:hypothetical protein [Sansalvadorimonas sp. 2012CJ34-2]MCL6271780.1 hypothetical protein [Sansalvadorimonas sp. 2012CJ34-2]